MDNPKIPETDDPHTGDCAAAACIQFGPPGYNEAYGLATLAPVAWIVAIIEADSSMSISQREISAVVPLG
ncbi:hypothetical protein HK100_008187 [Physocladia obscura]|uniref:Uncharacterized protein n=1 Tax=Physocladia obscura TaxID=109957 RepID=A0AAD5SNG6_9FUNG|nr:hypothetical protein HK100_008187 [Physocladia obscura]